nr:myosin heavy chain, cardiac muscle isoform-like isoform X2 [Ipomoea batatas]GMD38262.1 myosin heavy chain, cardiac muscle isoform-like isoform X2 [Ipomoea batatas]
MGEEDALRTVDCLRGRLLAERVASKNAKEEAQLMGNKLIELENRLKEETKSRNRAEKRLKFLMKKLQSINVSFVSDESENSCLTEGSEVSSADLEDKMPRIETARSSEGDSPEPMENAKSDNNENTEADSKKCEKEENSNMNNLKTSAEEKEMNDLDRDESVDNSLALVPVDLPKPKQAIDPAVLDATVRDVLDSLRHAKEKLQNQMERRRMITVG